MMFDERIYKKMQKPIDEIKEDYLIRKEVFASEPWYNDLVLYLSIGVCQPQKEHILSVRKALKMFGHETGIRQTNGMEFIVPYVKEHSKNPKQREER